MEEANPATRALTVRNFIFVCCLITCIGGGGTSKKIFFFEFRGTQFQGDEKGGYVYGGEVCVCV